ncbi:hypothetical protein TrRE_jg10627 [Triparma retinervis]|uniref:RanBD1 domain-containing protein n=1 Tax=Triparma retinervis TaxID=2557542 RepID=A0A9W6ZQ45_9STRA|nr:hypothetical protein TrRE_jg10627 [Triparma retinervis]
MPNKRQNTNSQVNRLDYEDDNVGDEAGEFKKASADVLKKRKKIVVSGRKRYQTTGNAGAGASSLGNNLGKSAPSKSGGVFGGVNLAPSGAPPARAPASPNPFASVVLGGPSSSASSSSLPVWGAKAPGPAPAPSAPSTPSAPASKIERLNASFIKWLKRQSVQNPASDYSAGISDYINHATKIAAEEEKPKAVAAPPVPASATIPAPTPTPAPASAPAPAFAGFGAKPSSSAPTPSFNFGSTSSSVPAPAATKPAFNFPSAPAPAPAAPKAVVSADAGDSMPKEDPTQLGKEENTEEDLLLEVRCKYYRFKKGDGWKDRGVGILKCYRHKTQGSCRIVMRNSIGKVGLNVAVGKGMEFEKIGGKQSSVKFIAMDEEGVGQIMLKTRPENLDKFHSTLTSMTV